MALVQWWSGWVFFLSATSSIDIRTRHQILDFKGHVQQFLFNFKRIGNGVELKDLG